MKIYIVKLKSGLICEVEATDEKHLFQKIDSGNYGILPIRGSESEKIARENISKIVEKNKGIRNRTEDF